MAVRDKSQIENFTRGGDVFSHKLSMFTTNAWRVTWKAISIGFVLAIMAFYLTTTPGERDVGSYYQLARLETAVSLGTSKLLARQVVIDSVGDLGRMMPVQIVNKLRPSYEQHLVGKTFFALVVFLIGTIASAIAIINFYRWFGVKAGEEDIRRGALQTTVPSLNKAVAASREGASDLSFVGVKLPADAPMKNICALGPMGTGKSVALLNLADQVLLDRKSKAPRKAIIYDKTGEMTSYYFREGRDILLSPLDVRGESVNLFKEVHTLTDFKQICESVIPVPDGGDPVARFFAQSAQTVVQSTMERLWQSGEGSMETLYKVLCEFSLAEKQKFLKGTPGALAIGGKGDQTAGIIQTIQNSVDSFRYFRNGDFSIKDWVKSDDDCNIFITSQESFHDVMRGSYYLLVDMAVRAAMSGPTYRRDRLWIFLDELASLGALPILKRSLTEARKYGVAHACGFQHRAQMHELFGNNISQVIRSNLQNFLVMRLPDESSRLEIAKDFGSAEVDENTEGVSFGAATSRDGSSVQTSRRDKMAVTEGELKKLKNLEGFLQIAGDYDPVRVNFADLIRDRKQIAAPYVPRPDLQLAAQGSGELTASKAGAATGKPQESQTIVALDTAQVAPVVIELGDLPEIPAPDLGALDSEPRQARGAQTSELDIGL